MFVATAVKKRLRTDLHSQEQSPAPLLRNSTTARANAASAVTATATAQRFAVMTQLRSLTALRWSTLLSAAVAESALPPVRITLYSLEKKQAQLLCVARQRTAARSQERYVQTAVSAVRYARKNVLTVRLSLRITTLLSTMTNVPRAAPAYLPVRESALSI